MIDVLAALPTPSFPSITSVLFPIRPSSLYPSSHPQFRSILLFNNIKGVFGCSGSGCVLSRFCTKTYILSKGSLGEKAAVPGGSRRFQAGSKSKTHPDPCQTDRPTDRPTDPRPTHRRPTDRPADRPTTDRPTDRPTDRRCGIQHGSHPFLEKREGRWVGGNRSSCIHHVSPVFTKKCQNVGKP